MPLLNQGHLIVSAWGTAIEHRHAPRPQSMLTLEQWRNLKHVDPSLLQLGLRLEGDAEPEQALPWLDLS